MTAAPNSFVSLNVKSSSTNMPRDEGIGAVRRRGKGRGKHLPCQERLTSPYIRFLERLAHQSSKEERQRTKPWHVLWFLALLRHHVPLWRPLNSHTFKTHFLQRSLNKLAISSFPLQVFKHALHDDPAGLLAVLYETIYCDFNTPFLDLFSPHIFGLFDFLFPEMLPFLLL